MLFKFYRSRFFLCFFGGDIKGMSYYVLLECLEMNFLCKCEN